MESTINQIGLDAKNKKTLFIEGLEQVSLKRSDTFYLISTDGKILEIFVKSTNTSYYIKNFKNLQTIQTTELVSGKKLSFDIISTGLIQNNQNTTTYNKKKVVSGTKYKDTINFYNDEDLRELKGLTFNAGDGNDKIYGTKNKDIINGGNGNDTIQGYGGDDVITGGKGNNTIVYDLKICSL